MGHAATTTSDLPSAANGLSSNILAIPASSKAAASAPFHEIKRQSPRLCITAEINAETLSRNDAEKNYKILAS